MMDLVGWLHEVPRHRVLPLFDFDDSLVVRTRISGLQGRRLLKRSHLMEEGIVDLVENGRNDDRWEGLLYVMGTGQGNNFRPRYIGKAERRGVKNELSANIVNIRTNKHMFARWGDGVAYHIGDLSHVLFGFEAYRQPTKKYQKWADALFATKDPPCLREPVFLWVAPWYNGTRGPSGLSGSLPAVEKQVIALASEQFRDCLLNVDGT